MSWRGKSLEALPTLHPGNYNAPPVVQSSDHEVFVEMPLPPAGAGQDPKPCPAAYHDVWDTRHVLMPNSAHSLYPNKKAYRTPDEPSMIPRWPIICSAYKRPIKTFYELHHAILKYNHKQNWSFKGLKNLIEQEMTDDERKDFFEIVLAGIVKLTVSLPEIVTKPPPLLKKETNASITMSQKQVACLLANAFLCTFPDRDTKEKGAMCAQCPTYPSINFSGMFNFASQKTNEKLRCIIQYFKEIIVNGRDGLVTFSRQFISPEKTPEFHNSSKKLPDLHITSKGGIETATGLLQMDFADPFIGGLVFNIGCVQEEIRFVLSPELLITRLFTERLEERDSFIIIGAEQYNNGSGYGMKFKWAGPHKDGAERDEFKRKLVQVVALDATRYSRGRNPAMQYEEEYIMRDVIKAYAGFKVLQGSLGEPIAVATGNWGCGVFKGNPNFKGLLQMVAAGEAGRDMAYFTWRDDKLRDELNDMHQFLTRRGVTVSQLLKVLLAYGESRKECSDLYPFIKSKIATTASAHSSKIESGNPKI